MNQQDAQNYIEYYQAKMDSIPEELEDLLLSDTYTGFISGIQKQFKLSEEQKNGLDQVVFNICIGVLSGESDVRNELSGIKIEGDLQDKILAFVDDYIIEPLLEEDTVKEEGANSKKPEIVSLPIKPSAPLIPTIRDYSTEQSGTGDVKRELGEVQHIDPYREIPEK